jgi:hypothetical protein
LLLSGGHAYGGAAQDSAPSNRSLLQSAGWTPFSPMIHASNGPAFAATFPSVRQNASLAPFCTENDHFAQTGSGQTRRKS